MLKRHVLPLLGLAVLALAGCSTSSIAPGLGGTGGINTPGSGVSNPEATLYCRLKGTPALDFIATDAVGRTNPLGVQLEAQGPGFVSGRDLKRIVLIDFFTTPVPGTTYSVGQFGAADAAVTYSEQIVGESKVGIWQAESGSVKVTKLEGDIIKGTFDAKLIPASDATGNLTLSGGNYSVKVLP